MKISEKWKIHCRRWMEMVKLWAIKLAKPNKRLKIWNQAFRII
jgi:hypothetical protein